jgi:DNA polymerase-3 subunit beta
MKVTVERSELLKSLGHVHRVVERRNTIPILGNVLLRADRSKLSLKATDLDIEVTDTIAAEVGPGGSTTVPAHMLFDIIRKLPEGAQVVVESSGDRAALAIRAGRSRFTLQTLPESDFPDLAPGEMTHKFTVKAVDLDRRNPLLPQRHLPACRRQRQGADLARSGNRWPSAGPGRA